MMRFLHGSCSRTMLSLGLGLLPGAALAAVSCSVTTNPMIFSGYNTVAAATSVSTVTVNCNNNGKATATPVTVAASAGNGTIAQRQMVSGTRTLDYNLYIDAAYATVWGNTTGSQFSGTTNGTTGNASFTVYGRIRSGQDVVPGSYATTTPVTTTATY
jgi:spore coat protein U-like protein